MEDKKKFDNKSTEMNHYGWKIQRNVGTYYDDTSKTNVPYDTIKIKKRLSKEEKDDGEVVLRYSAELKDKIDQLKSN